MKTQHRGLATLFPLFALLAAALSACGPCGAPPESPPVIRDTGPIPTPSAYAEPKEPEQTLPTEADYGDTLVTGSIGDIINLIGFLSSDSGSHQIAGLLYDSIIEYDEELNFAPRLASSWDISEDKRSFTFHLRKDVKWQDGKPFGAADVEWTFKAIIDPDTPSPYAEDYLRVEKFEVLDPHTFRVTYPGPYAPALESWASFQPLPKHELIKFFKPGNNRVVDSPLKEHPVGNGPYVLEEWVRNQHVILKRNENYYGGRQYVGRYHYRVIADQSTMFNELRAGGLDQMGLTPQQFKHQAQSKEFKERFNYFNYLARGYSYMGFNLENPLFTDKHVRQAIAYAINQQAIIDGVFLSQAVRATGPYVPQTRWHNPNIKGYPHDPGRAKALLTVAGWKDTDGDGVLDKGGKPFAFTLITNAGNELRSGIATVIQSNLKRVGIRVEIQTLEWATFLKEFIGKQNYDAFILGWSLGLDPDQYIIWHSSKAKPGELNHVLFKNAEADKLLEEGRRTLDADKRQEIYWRFQEVLQEEVPYVFLTVGKSNVVVDKRFHGARAVPLMGVGYSFSRNEWFVPKALQKY